MSFSPAQASTSVTLAWFPSPDVNVTGYRVYYGTLSHNYTGVISTGTSAIATIPNLIEGTTYYFAVTAVNVTGMESAFSNEASYTVSVRHPQLQLLISPGKQKVLRVIGRRNHAYEIQATQNFTHWSMIGVVVLDSGESVDFTDVNVASFPARFYRLRDLSRPRLELRISPSKQVILRIIGQPGRSYEVQTTQNFTNWSMIGVVGLDSGGSVDFTDVNVGSFPARFYRLRDLSRPRLELRVSPSKQVILRIIGQPGRSYEVQVTQNFTTWTAIGSVQLGSTGYLDFLDATAASQPARFYRLRINP